MPKFIISPKNLLVSAMLVGSLFSISAFATLKPISPELSKDIGQMMMVGMKGTSVTENSPIVQEIKNYHIGGVILFPKSAQYPEQNIENPQQLKKLTAELQFYAKKYDDYPLLITANQEGGEINGLKPSAGFQMPLNYSEYDLGLKNDLALTKRQAFETAKMLKYEGVNVNLAPVADLDINKKSDVIARWGRSFGVNKIKVGNQIQAAVEGYEQGGVLTTLKHFPGLGSALGNTDFGGYVNITDTWKKKEVGVYKYLIQKHSAGPLIMISHAINTKIDSSALPASLSYNTVTGLLRNKLHYNGVVITDDLDAKAITGSFTDKQATYLAVNAGDNILLYGGGLGHDATQVTDEFHQNMVDLTQNDPLFRSKIKQSALRIKALKNKLLSTQQNS